jgi:hypothetical protein
MWSSTSVTPIQSPFLLSTSNPSALAPTNSVMRLISSCSPARMASLGSPVMGG